jgi:SAM-dependent methyltransferase
LTTTPQADGYDTLPYDGGVAPSALPARLLAVARMHGYAIAPVRRTHRVLDLGCGVGTHLLAIASTDPACVCVGVDRSPRQIDIARQRAQRLGLGHTRWIAADFADLGRQRLDPFDFIICHGVLSWVPSAVRQALLAVIRSHLAPGGIAYISFNLLPGWGHGLGLREALLAQVPPELAPAEQVAAMRQVLRLIAEAADGSSLGRHTREAAQALASFPDDYLFHEYLEADNHPLRFAEFAGEAAQQGLRWVGEAHPGAETRLPPRVRQYLAAIADPLAREQARDQLTFNTFRMSLCVRADAAEPPVAASDGQWLQTLHVAAPLQAPAQWSWSLLQPADFEHPDGSHLRAVFPVAKAACQLLAERWPGSLPVTDLLEQAQARLLQAGLAPSADDHNRLLGFLAAAVRAGQVEALAWPRPLGPRPAEAPCAWPLARLLAEEGRTFVPTALPTNHALTAAERSLLLLCDGQRSRDAIAAALACEAATAALAEGLDARLAQWHRAGLLCSAPVG